MKTAKLALVTVLLLANSAMAGVLVQTARFEQGQISVHATDGYQVITVPGCPTSSELGKPSLPQVARSVVLPAGAVMTGVQVTSVDERPLPGEYLIAPAQRARPLPMPGKTFEYPPAEPDKSVYGTDRVYPEQVVRSLGSGAMCGYAIGRVQINPVRYNPATRTAYLVRSVTYAITYRENAEPAAVATRYQLEVFGQMARALAENPEDVERFAPPVRPPAGTRTLPAGQFPYVTISGSAAFDTVFARLAAWKTSKGVRDTVIPIAYITANYSGYDNTERIRNFIIDARNTWGTVYVLLGGQGDDKNSGQNLIPARHAYYTNCGAGYYTDENQIPSDLYYSDLDGTWDADGDHTYGELADNVNLYPDVLVGRAPVLTVAQAQNFVAKVLKYEQAPPTGYLKKMLLPTAILWSSYEERPTQRYIAAMTPSGWTDDSLFERRSTLSQSAMVASMNAGRGLGHWMGHGDENGIYMGSSAFYSSSTADAASNGDKQGVHISIACFTGAMDEVSGGDCFAEHIINRAGGGAVGVIMNSRYGWGAYVGGYVMGPSEMLDTTFMNRIFHGGIYRQGQALASAKTAWAPYADQSNQYSYMRWCLYELNLFGDPELPIWTEEADSMRLTYNATLPTGSGSYSVTVKDRSNAAISGALVCLRTKSNSLYATGTTNSSGVAAITVNPASAETLFISATSRNKLAAFGKALITGAATPTLAVSMTSWTPAAAGGTSGAVNVTNSGTTSAIAYTVSSNQSWLTVSASSGSTPGSFTMTAAANTGAARTATVTVTATTSGVSGSPKTITITQAAATATPTLAVSLSSWSVAAAGGTSSTVSVTNSGSTSVIAYTVSSNQNWLTVSATSGNTPGSFTMTASANTSTSSRTATVTVTATTSGVSGSPKTITVTQAAATAGQNDAGTGGDAGNTIATATLVSPGSWTGCYLDATDRNDYYKFSVTSGQVIKVKVTPPSSADYDLYLHNPSQTQVASSLRGTGYVDSVVYTANATGYWYARAYEYSGIGNYSLLISVSGGTAPTLAVSLASWSPAAAGGTSGAVNVTNSTTSDVITYTVSSSQSWLTVSAPSGNTPGTFTMTAAANTGAARTATVTVTATAPSGTQGSPKTIAVSQAAASGEVTIFSDNMTSFPTGWTLSPSTGGWTKTSTKYNSASYSAMGDNVSNYGNSQNNYMTRSVNLSGYSSATLKFHIWQYTESGYDYVYLQYYSGSTWTTAWSRAGSYQSWSQQSVSIPTTATQVRFYFKSDASLTYTGAYVDDVVLTATSGSGGTPNYAKSTAAYSWVTTSTSLGLSGDDAYKAVALPFAFNFYGTNYASVNVCTNGFLNFGTSSTAYSPAAIPSSAAPNALMAVLWRDLNADASTSITYSSSTSQFVVTYGNIKNYSNTSRQTFQVVLTPDGKIKYQWQTVTNDVTTSIGVENQGGTLGVSHTGPTSGSAILFTPPTSWTGLPLLAGELEQDQGPFSTELLSQNFPNPAVGRTSIVFNIPNEREVSLRIYNAAGQLVKTLASGAQKAGYHKLEWDARDDRGHQVANGTYIYHLEAGDLKATRKMLVLK